MTTTVTDRLTQEEAEQRFGAVADVSYALDLDLEAGAKTFSGDVTITFTHRGGDTFLEWVGGEITGFWINGEAVDPEWDGARITLPADRLQPQSEVRITYTRPYDHTGEGFHQFIDPSDESEYLYTQFEPYSAHRLLPCFDQPDLKAHFEVSVTAPSAWLVTTAGRELERSDTGDGRSRRVFERTVPFSTYLFSIVAGDYASVYEEHDGIALGLHVRTSLLPHLDADDLFDLTKRAIDFFGEWFDEPYPFGKYDQVFVPEFNWGGMENVGNVTYTDLVVFRDPPTQDQLLRRAEYFTHELAHMWFGNLVTMKWWNDLWLNESFASYAGYLALERLGDFPAIWQDFNTRMKLWAYREDQRPTTHRIADEVPSTDETFLNFDGITYGKGAAVLRQLVYAIGDDSFAEGLREYFRRHRFSNATVHDFLAALQEQSDLDMLTWAARWLKAPSLNTLALSWKVADGKVASMQLEQTAPDDHPYLRPHTTAIGLIDGEGGEHALKVSFTDASTEVPEAVGLPAPVFAFPNAGDHAYAKVKLDADSLAYARGNLGTMPHPLLRHQVWSSLWEMVRDQQLSSLAYLDLVHDHLPAEESLPIVQMVTATVAASITRYVPEDRIDELATRFVTLAEQKIPNVVPGDRAVLWARALLSCTLTTADARRAALVIDNPVDGLAVDQDMRWAVAVRWAALGIDADERIAAEQERDPTDRGARALVAVEAARPDADIKQQVWERIHNDGYESLRLAMAAAGAFWQRSQQELLAPYVDRFFTGLPKVFADWGPETARRYFETIFPHHLISEDTQHRIAAVLQRDDIGPMLRRMLIEADHDLDRAIRCREVA